jgi:hypothetical protein
VNDPTEAKTCDFRQAFSIVKSDVMAGVTSPSLFIAKDDLMTYAGGQLGLPVYLNGKRAHLRDVDPSTLLADHLRSPEVGLTGTKNGYKSGGCGPALLRFTICGHTICS